MEIGIVLGKHGKELGTDVLLHPGEVLRMEIDAREIKKTELAEALNIKPGNLTELLQGKRHVSAVLALKLEAIFGINAPFWLGIQADYDLGLAKRDFSKTLYLKLKRRSKTFRGVGLGQS
jgi:addiction module HigA family antidote